VPAIVTPEGQLLMENVAILSWIASQASFAAACGVADRGLSAVE
jgi:glutathione S-transferase